MNETSPPAAPASGAETLKLLCERYAVFRDNKPLAIGIHKAVKAALPELDAGALRHALHRHTASTRYLKAVATGEDRFDLDGAVAGAITEEQKQVAADSLRERFKKGAERRRVEQLAEKKKVEEAARDKERQAKLAQLALKFNKR